MSSSWDPTKIEVANFLTLCIESQMEDCLDWHISELTVIKRQHVITTNTISKVSKIYSKT